MENLKKEGMYVYSATIDKIVWSFRTSHFGVIISN